MAIIRRKNRNGTTTFQVKVRDHDGAWFPTASFISYEDAHTEESRLLGLKKKGSKAFSQDAKVTTLDEYWEVWSVENRTDVSKGWKISQDQMYRDYIKPTLGERKLIQIGTPEIGKALNQMKEKGLSDQTRKHVYSMLRKMFNDAVEYYEMLASNPVKSKFHKPQVKSVIRDFLHPNQAWTLLREAKKHSYLGPPIWLQTLSALRVEAVIALDWECISWDHNQILICRAWKQKEKIIADYPKGKDWEYVPMPTALKEYLWQVWVSRRMPKLGFVCLSEKGQRLSYNTYLGALKNFCKKVGLTTVTTHELRHTSTELYFQAGASTEDIRRLLNHRSLNATKRYIHRTNDRLDSIAKNIGLDGQKIWEHRGNIEGKNNGKGIPKEENAESPKLLN